MVGLTINLGSSEPTSSCTSPRTPQLLPEGKEAGKYLLWWYVEDQIKVRRPLLLFPVVGAAPVAASHPLQFVQVASTCSQCMMRAELVALFKPPVSPLVATPEPAAGALQPAHCSPWGVQPWQPGLPEGEGHKGASLHVFVGVRAIWVWLWLTLSW